ncbi:N(G)-N(G)-dimethylarginine dimethylaminohydrolase 1 [Brachionus plicatilis]|uniref:N(G)-N(G)-dimethylarginine dimethylaminohydrolase 1 n=1 Tax=Brachionus plicatilis TaxID=10195 RepID=A0A3M7R5R8_BRAPC|nr:N(G)-N(G)-dimethylarginine dimethylaminohydrolase 1 [Brachionus plicatilis]
MNFEYTHALVCDDVPKSVINGLSLDEHEPVDYEMAKNQHESYLKHLESCGIKLVKIQSNENHPDCVFVEDTCIALGNKIFITNPGAESRRNEVLSVKSKLEQISKELNLQIGTVQNTNESFIEGGDCMFTGKEFIIGTSTRTNQKGIDEFKTFFSEYSITVCQVSEGLHLKSFMSMISPGVIIISRTKEANLIQEQIIMKSKFGSEYEFVKVDENCAANILNMSIYNLQFPIM